MSLIHILDKGVERDVDESLLVRQDTKDETDDYVALAVEYRFPGDDTIVHRSAHIIIKRFQTATGELASLG